MKRSNMKLVRLTCVHPGFDSSKDQRGCTLALSKFAENVQVAIDKGFTVILKNGLSLSPESIIIFDLTEEEFNLLDRFYLEDIGCTDALYEYMAQVDVKESK